MSDPNLTIDDINALPERMRAHAAARAVGMSSREFLAAMAGIGVEIKSAQSGVTRQVLLDWFTSRGQDTGTASGAAPAGDTGAQAPVAEASATDAPARKAPAKKAAAKRAAKAPARKTAEKTPTAEVPADPASAEATAAGTTPAETPAEAPAAESATGGTAATETAPAKKASGRKSPARKTTAEKTAEKATDAEKSASRSAEKSGTRTGTKSVQGSADDSAGTGGAGTSGRNRPALPEIAIVTGEVGSEESGNRRRRSTATPSFSPLFLSPDEAPAQTQADTRSGDEPRGRRGQGQTQGRARTETAPDAAPTPPAEDTQVEQDGQEQGSDDGRATDQSDSGDGGTRRRRRGRRGRGRGRGEAGDDQNGENTGTESSDDGDQRGDDQRDSDPRGDDQRGSDPRDSDPDETSGSDDGSSDARSDSAGETDDRSADDSDGQSGPGDADGDDSDDSGNGPSGSRRRRRRRRRSGGSGSDDTQTSNDDPPQTEVHEREARRRSGRGGQGSGTSSDEVQGITGSTRLEAKRQRRRDGREAGRRRQPILSESEFLARREAVDRVMVVREKQRGDGKGVMTQVGVLEDKVLVEHFVTTESARSMVGNVYLGRVQNVLPSMEAAFVDIGRGRNGVLYAGEVNWEAAGLGGKARRIEQALKSGDMVLVQVTKDPIGQKGARLSTQISLAGRFLVYVPDGNSTGISRKLPDTERRRLKAILKEVVPEGSGVIIRTAAEGVSAEEIGRDVERLAAQWTEISEAATKRTDSGAGTPVSLYEEPDLLVKVVRDLFNEDFSKLVIQGETSWDTVHDYVSRVAPEMTERVERYDNPDVDVFATYRVDEQLAKALDRKVWLPSGGSLVIDRTEAMTVIDVNTGKYTGSGGNLEETVTKNNLEAAEEIVRQLRLRDVGGMVIIDFIDMVLESNRDLVLRRLTEALGRDRTRHQVSEVTSLGLVQLTRKKLGTGLVEAFSTPCEHCQGRGLIVHADPLHTESHNADEPGGRRGRRKGGNGKGSGESEAPAPKQAARKDGPAPAAHPAALAISRQHTEADADSGAEPNAQGDTRTDGGRDTDQGRDAAPETRAAGRADAGARGATAPEVVTAPAAEAPAAPAAEQTAEPTPGTAEPDSADAAGTTRPARRRRAARRATSSAPAPTTAAEDAAAAEVTDTPQSEAAVVAEAETVVEQVSTPGPDTAGPDTGPTGQAPGGRRPRRRSTRREAGAAGTDTAPQAAPADPVAKVEAAPLAEAPTTVVAEPRTRPARRRATRTTTAPAGD
ncbi:Rne/Rng family ribonuclease [Dietzia kunjamensis]|uniref:Rne/Rng family ribonuclease n=1 Tax=Dietzia kunjamensis TaxID=322509 RepID=UPI0024B9A28D|nr:Rne/Rng family ribonuclease [Dietzia kunjamensis]MDJ0422109.1 Rne/Rng family ribonuclease [Dietzia kunjamensis]